MSLNKFAGGIIGALVVMGIRWGSGGFMSEEEVVRKGLQEAEVKINAKCPMMIDAKTRMDKVKTGERSITYYYTVMGLPDEIVKAASDEIKAEIANEVHKTKDTQNLLDHDVKMNYSYRNEGGEELIAFTVVK